MKIITLMLLSLIAVSCGKKIASDTSASGSSSSALVKKEYKTSDKVIDERTCIDDTLVSELGDEDIVKKVVDDSDISFCNGARLRVKIFKISSGELRAYGFVESNSGHKSCLKQGPDFQKIPLFGYSGSFVGDKLKVTLGGSQYDSKGKLIRSEHFSGKFVKLDSDSYKGEVGLYEGKGLTCAEINGKSLFLN